MTKDCALDKLERFLRKQSITDRKVWDGLETLRQADGLSSQEYEQMCLLVRQFVEELTRKSVKRDLLKAVDDLKEAPVRRP
jgi:hypothetical protein